MNKPLRSCYRQCSMFQLSLVFVVFSGSWTAVAAASSGGGLLPFNNNDRYRWGILPSATMGCSATLPPHGFRYSRRGGNAPDNEHSRRRAKLVRAKISEILLLDDNDYYDEKEDTIKSKALDGHESSLLLLPFPLLRGGQGADAFIKVVGSVTEVLVQCGRLVLPPAVATVKFVAGVYRALPKDAIVAQIGLVYCFAGGYYPTLFSSLQAAQQYGWNTMVEAITDLTDEAMAVILALEEARRTKQTMYESGNNEDDSSDDDDEETTLRQKMRKQFRQNTSIVLATVDPIKINQAAGALYTTWLGVSVVLEREYARVITLSMTLADSIERVMTFFLTPPACMCVAPEYHRWIPVVIGWGCKALAMNLAWRLQRLMTAASSAVMGGQLFARAFTRMVSNFIRKRNVKKQQQGRWWHRTPALFQPSEEKQDNPFIESSRGVTATSLSVTPISVLDDMIGFLVAALGFYTQFEAQWRSGFSFRVPFPFSLVTWPFDWAERWIQWQITK